MGRARPITRPRLGLAALTIGLTGAPLLYYVILTRADLAWHLAREASKHSFPLGSIVIAIIPLLLPALLAYRHRPRTFLAAATRVWPIAAFGVYFLSGTGAAATPLHAFQGITFPLSVLAIEGLQSIGWRRIPARPAGRRGRGRGRRDPRDRLRALLRARRWPVRRPETPTSSPAASATR